MFSERVSQGQENKTSGEFILNFHSRKGLIESNDFSELKEEKIGDLAFAK